MVAALTVGQITNATLQLGLIIGSGIVGCLLAFALFRIWMGISLALLGALLVPAIGLIWLDAPAPAGPDDAQDLSIIPKVDAIGESEDGQTDVDREWVERWAARIQAHLNQIVGTIKSQIEARWQGIAASQRLTMYVAAGIMASIGLLAGLLAPTVAASIASALVGSVLMISSGIALVRVNTTDGLAWLPDSSPYFFTATGLITIVGIVLQWTLFRRKADA